MRRLETAELVRSSPYKNDHDEADRLYAEYIQTQDDDEIYACRDYCDRKWEAYDRQRREKYGRYRRSF